METQREADHIKQLFKVEFKKRTRLEIIFYFYLFQECEADLETKKSDVGELLAKCRAGLVDYQANVNTMDVAKFAEDMKNENEFMNGLQQQLVPWGGGDQCSTGETKKL